MKFKKSLITSLLIGTIYAGSVSAGITCEALSPTSFACEEVSTNPQQTNYAWTSTGALSITGGGGPFRFVQCTPCISNSSGSIKVTTTENGVTSNFSQVLSCPVPAQTCSTTGGFLNDLIGH